MAVTKYNVMILMNRVRKALDNPDLDFVNNDTDVMTAMLAYGVHFKYMTSKQFMNCSAQYRLGGRADGPLLVVTDGPIPMKWMRACQLCFAILRQLGLSLSETDPS